MKMQNSSNVKQLKLVPNFYITYTCFFFIDLYILSIASQKIANIIKDKDLCQKTIASSFSSKLYIKIYNLIGQN